MYSKNKRPFVKLLFLLFCFVCVHLFPLFRSDTNVRSIVFLNAETVLHDYWGGPDYWLARRSMRFNSFLVQVANDFRRQILNSTDAFDGTERPSDWRHERVFQISK